MLNQSGRVLLWKKRNIAEELPYARQQLVRASQAARDSDYEELVRLLYRISEGPATATAALLLGVLEMSTDALVFGRDLDDRLAECEVVARETILVRQPCDG